MELIFIVWAEGEKERVMRMKGELESRLGLRCGVGYAGEASPSKKKERLKAIDGCVILIYLFHAGPSMGAHPSDELRYADRGRKRIVFVSLDGCLSPSPFTRSYGGREVFDGSDIGALSAAVMGWLGMPVQVENLYRTMGADGLYQAGVDYYSGGHGKAWDHKEAVKCFWLAARKGSLEALMELGHCYRLGHGVGRDRTMAFHCFQAAGGLPDAMFEVAECYRYGDGVRRDWKEAFQWYKMATDKGHLEALLRVAECYSFGIGIERNDREALRYYEKAAERGHVDAMYEIGDIYRIGQGVERDRTKAFRWYNRAAENGHEGAMRQVGECYRFGHGVERDPMKALRYYRRAAAWGDPDAYDLLKEKGIPIWE